MLDELRKNLPRLPPIKVVNAEAVFRDLRVHSDGNRAAPPRVSYKARRRVNHAACSNHEKQVAFLDELIELVHAKGNFAEPDDMRAEQSSARAARQLREVFGRLPNSMANRAADFRQFAVHVVEVLAAGFSVQVVNVLSDESEVSFGKELFQAGEGMVCRIRLDELSLLSSFVVEAPDKPGVSFKTLGRGHNHHVVLLPNSSLVAEGGNAGFSADSGACQSDNLCAGSNVNERLHSSSKAILCFVAFFADGSSPCKAPIRPCFLDDTTRRSVKPARKRAKESA